MSHKIILFYKYIEIKDPEDLKKQQELLCKKLNLKGRMIIATEGVNSILGGSEENISEYVKTISKLETFANIHFKYSDGPEDAFEKLSVKVRSEIVAARLGKEDINPNEVTGMYLTPEQLHGWYETGKKFYIVDMRNNFEQIVGHFKDSILSEMATFAQLPEFTERLKKLEKGVPIVTVCTGGVRCEKASGFLVKKGFNQVYQLFGGMHAYMEKYPNGYFKGALYTFDGRVVMGFNLDDPKREIIGKCAACQTPNEHYINCADPFCNRHMIVCKNCLNGQEKIKCPMGCRDYSLEHPEAFA